MLASAEAPSPAKLKLQTARSRQDHALVRQALTWLQALGVDGAPSQPPETSFWSYLLGRAADAVQASRGGGSPAPRRVPPLPSPLGAGSTHHQHRRSFRDRINDYNRWQQLCLDLGVRADLLPPLTDLEQGQGTAAVAASMWAVASKCEALGLQVPPFGSADARSSLQRSMPRDASARRAELFSHEGSSPPKLPALPLLTPRAFHGKGGSELIRSSSGSGSALRDSNGGSMHEWLADARCGRDGQGQEVRGSATLGRTIAALERASAESQHLQGSDQQQQRQQRRRPMLPRLDVEAAAAQAAADAAEEGQWVGAEGDSPSPSPLSSPTASSTASPSVHSSSALSSPEALPRASPSPTKDKHHHRHQHSFTPSRFATRLDNPLWSQSPDQPQQPASGGWTPAAAAAPRAGGAGDASPQAAANPVLSSGSRWEQVPEMGSPVLTGSPGGASAAAADAVASSAARAGAIASPEVGAGAAEVRSSEGEARVSFDGYSGDGGLLESLLCPPPLKPAHTRLLGQLMHTSSPALGSSHGAAARIRQLQEKEQQQQQQQQQQEEEAGHKEQEEDEAGHKEQGEGRIGQAAHSWQQGQAASKGATAGLQAAAEPGASAAAPTTAATASSCGGRSVRRVALVVLGAVAGAVAAMAAGAVQQGPSKGSAARRRPRPRSPLLHAQPVPSMHNAHRRVLSGEQAQAAEEPKQEHRQLPALEPAGWGASSTGSSSGGGSWDSPDALFTRG